MPLRADLRLKRRARAPRLSTPHIEAGIDIPSAAGITA